MQLVASLRCLVFCVDQADKWYISWYVVVEVFVEEKTNAKHLSS